jgi:amidase
VPPISPVGRRPARALRIGFYLDPTPDHPVDPMVRAAVEDAARLCASLGHAVEEVPCPFSEQRMLDFIKLWGVVAWAQAGSARLVLHRGFDPSKFEPWTLGVAEYARRTPWQSLQSIRRLRGSGAEWARKLEGYDVLLSPTLAQPPPAIGHLRTDVPFDEALRRLIAFSPFTGLHNAAGAPALSLPLGRTPSGLPIGVQFAAAFGNDRLLLELGLALEEAAPWPRAAPL